MGRPLSLLALMLMCAQGDGAVVPEITRRKLLKDATAAAVASGSKPTWADTSRANTRTAEKEGGALFLEQAGAGGGLSATAFAAQLSATAFDCASAAPHEASEDSGRRFSRSCAVCKAATVLAQTVPPAVCPQLSAQLLPLVPWSLVERANLGAHSECLSARIARYDPLLRDGRLDVRQDVRQLWRVERHGCRQRPSVSA